MSCPKGTIVNITYEDTGCHLHPKCLECPEPYCIYETEEKVAIDKNERNNEIYKLYLQKVQINVIAEKYGLSRHMVRKIIIKVKKELGI